jgi:hypothetical protein
MPVTRAHAHPLVSAAVRIDEATCVPTFALPTPQVPTLPVVVGLCAARLRRSQSTTKSRRLYSPA